MKEPYPQRRDPRLKGWDYGQNGAYFITICTKNRRPILSSVSPPRDHSLGVPLLRLLDSGVIVDRQIRMLGKAYPWLVLHHYVVMPNHVHLLLEVRNGASRTPPPTDEERGKAMEMVPKTGTVGAGLPDRPQNRAGQRIPMLISTLKRFTNRDAGQELWQRGYHDHVIRGEEDFLRVWTYIDHNPLKWELDEYYIE